MERFIALSNSILATDVTSFKIQYGEIYSTMKVNEIKETVENLKSSMERFIVYQEFSNHLKIPYLKSSMERFIAHRFYHNRIPALI